MGAITRSLLVRDAKTKEKLAHGVLESQNERQNYSVMDAKESPDADVTGLLQAWRGGDIDARDRLAAVVYQELRRRAAAICGANALDTRCSRRRWSMRLFFCL